MNNEISKNLKCLLIRGGVEIWMESKRAENLRPKLLNLSSHVFFEYEGRTINTADVSGIYTAQDMEGVTRRKNGQWQCKYSTWHDRGGKCECLPPGKEDIQAQIAQTIANCGQCKDGWIQDGNSTSSVKRHSCAIELDKQLINI